jgi:tellurite resistance protein
MLDLPVVIPQAGSGPGGDPAMLARTNLDANGLSAQEALVCTMVLVAATGGGMSDREIGVMAGIVQTLPVFADFNSAQLDAATEAAIGLLREEDGLRHAVRLIRDALEPRLRETAYALACDVVAADGEAAQDSLRLLEFVKSELHVDSLVAAAVERGARVRHQLLAPPRG